MRDSFSVLLDGVLESEGSQGRSAAECISALTPAARMELSAGRRSYLAPAAHFGVVMPNQAWIPFSGQQGSGQGMVPKWPTDASDSREAGSFTFWE